MNNPDLNEVLDEEPELPSIYARCVKRQDGKYVWQATQGKLLLTRIRKYGLNLVDGISHAEALERYGPE